MTPRTWSFLTFVALTLFMPTVLPDLYSAMKGNGKYWRTLGALGIVAAWLGDLISLSVARYHDWLVDA